jgi:hypothetical protein
VAPIARRRRFSGSKKRRLLAEADRCKESGQLGAFLRRERIYSSMLASWRRLARKSKAQNRIPRRGRSNSSIATTPACDTSSSAPGRLSTPKKLCVALGLPTADETSEDE